MFQTFSPNRGSVAFWWSLDRKGHRLQKTLHGGCPILKGSKWIFNKWVHYFDQWKKFPCGLRAESTFDPPLLHYWIKLTLRGKKLPSNPQCWICLKMNIRQYAGSLNRWDKQLVDKVSDVPRFFFHNFL